MINVQEMFSFWIAHWKIFNILNIFFRALRDYLGIGVLENLEIFKNLEIYKIAMIHGVTMNFKYFLEENYSFNKKVVLLPFLSIFSLGYFYLNRGEIRAAFFHAHSNWTLSNRFGYVTDCFRDLLSGQSKMSWLLSRTRFHSPFIFHACLNIFIMLVNSFSSI